MDFSDLNIKNVDENLRNEFKELIKKEFIEFEREYEQFGDFDLYGD